MRIRDGSSDVCSSDLGVHRLQYRLGGGVAGRSAALPLVGLQPHQQVAAAAVGLDLGAVVAGGGQLLADVIDVGGAVEVHLDQRAAGEARSEEHTSELQSLMRISYAVFCLKKKKQYTTKNHNN